MFFILTQKSADRSHGNMAVNWAKGFFEQYGLKISSLITQKLLLILQERQEVHGFILSSARFTT